MKTIHKFPLKIASEQTIETPVDANPLCVQVQNGVPCLWAEVETRNPKFNKPIRMVGTGHPVHLTEADIYLGTIQLDGFVWHVYY